MKERVLPFSKRYALRNLDIKASNSQIFWTMVMLAWPTITEHFLETIVQYIDTAMVGQVSARASAVVGLSTTLNWLVNGPMFAIGIGFLAIVAKAMGDSDQKLIKKAADQAILLILVLGVVEGILTLALSPFIPGWMQADSLIRKDASIYFAVICFPMVFRAAIIILGSLLRGIGDTQTPLKINLFVNVLNIVLNMVLIYPTKEYVFFGITVKVYGLGLSTLGAGISTAIAFTIGGILMWRAFQNQPFFYSGARHIRFDKKIMTRGVKISLPLTLNKTVTSLGYVVFSGLVSSMGTFIFAAHAIAIVAEMIFYVPGYGMQAATSTMIGYTLGKKDWKLYMRTLLSNVFFIFILMLPLSIMLYVFATPVMRFFTSDEAVIALGASVLKLIAFSEPFFGVSIVLEGVYNGLGKTKYPFYIETTSMWCVRILGVSSIVYLGVSSLIYVWLFMIADNLLKTLLFGIGIFYKGQKKKLFDEALISHQT